MEPTLIVPTYSVGSVAAPISTAGELLMCLLNLFVIFSDFLFFSLSLGLGKKNTMNMFLELTAGLSVGAGLLTYHLIPRFRQGCGSAFISSGSGSSILG